MGESGSDLRRYPQRRNPPSEERVFQPNGSVTPTRPTRLHRLARLCLRPTSRRCECSISDRTRDGFSDSSCRRGWPCFKCPQATSTASAPNAPKVGSTVPKRAGSIVCSRSRHCCKCRTRRVRRSALTAPPAPGAPAAPPPGWGLAPPRVRLLRPPRACPTGAPSSSPAPADRAPRLPALAPELSHARALPPPALVGAVQGQLAIGPATGTPVPLRSDTPSV